MSNEKRPVPVPVPVPVERHFDAESLNRTLNDPSVYPWVRGSATGTLDLTAVVADPRNVLLCGEHGSMLFTPVQPGIWELHTQVLPTGRGEWTLGLAAACFHWMFTRTDAVEVLTRVPKGNVAALAAVRAVGFTHAWTMDHGWILRDAPVPAQIWSMTVQQWLGTEYSAMLDGDAAAFFEAAAAAASDTPPSDALRPMGFLLACVRGRQVGKGCVLMNRWASLAGFTPSFVAAADPLVVSIGGALLRFGDDGIPVGPATVH